MGSRLLLTQCTIMIQRCALLLVNVWENWLLPYHGRIHRRLSTLSAKPYPGTKIVLSRMEEKDGVHTSASELQVQQNHYTYNGGGAIVGPDYRDMSMSG